MSDWRDEWLEANRANWDERVPIHAAGEFYDVASFKEGQERLRPFEISEVGDVSGKDLVHLQCHFGIDTLGWARRGARVMGLDFSAPAVEEASKLAAELGLDAGFVRSDVYEAQSALGGRDFDVVYTGLGALNWLPDIRRWAGVAPPSSGPGGSCTSPSSTRSRGYSATTTSPWPTTTSAPRNPRYGTSPEPTPTSKPRRSTIRPTSGTTL
jgi:hypothetical protein